jgi:hypothetical protein
MHSMLPFAKTLLGGRASRLNGNRLTWPTTILTTECTSHSKGFRLTQAGIERAVALPRLSRLKSVLVRRLNGVDRSQVTSPARVDLSVGWVQNGHSDSLENVVEAAGFQKTSD